MATAFFERSAPVNGEQKIRIGDLELSLIDCSRLLQSLVIRKKGMDAEIAFKHTLDAFHEKLPKTIAAEVEKILTPLFRKMVAVFPLLVSVEDGTVLESVDFARVEAGLVAIDREVKVLFKQYTQTIRFFRSILIIVLKSRLKDPSTKAMVPEAFDKQSAYPLIQQMVEIEYHTYGIPVPVVIPVTCDDFTPIDDAGLDAVLDNITAAEPAINGYATQQQRYIRDLAYMQVLSTENFFQITEIPAQTQTHRLALLSPQQLSALAYSVMHSHLSLGEEIKQRATLQGLAILCELYRQISGTTLSEKELLSLLLALGQSHIELQWQLDAYHTPPAVLLLYCTVLCLRGDIVHIEQAAQLLRLEDASGANRAFLTMLNIVYKDIISPVAIKIGVLHTRALKSQPATYYFGSRAIQFSSHPACNHYLAQSLLEVKRGVLQFFDAWYAVLWQAIPNAELLQQYREQVIQKIEHAWMQHIQTHLPLKNLKQIDTVIAQFQQGPLLQIWQNAEQQLLITWRQQTTLSTEAKIRVAFLQEQSSKIQHDITTRHYARYAQSLAEMEFEGIHAQDKILARLYYDRSYLSHMEQMILVHRYLKQQLNQIQQICPALRKTGSPSEQLKLVLEHLATELERDAAISTELTAAVMMCMRTYHSVQPLLDWSTDPNLQARITLLTNVSADTAVRTLAQTVLTQLHWVTQTNTWYYLWIESRDVKRAAQQVYDRAQALSAAPHDKVVLNKFLEALCEQHHTLMQFRWYFPLGWLLGYPDMRQVLAGIIQHVHRMGVLEHVPPELLRAAQERALCVSAMRAFNHALQQRPQLLVQGSPWEAMQMHVQAIQTRHSGLAMMYELRAYLETQRPKFITTQRNDWFGVRQSDPVGTCLRILNQALRNIPHHPQDVLTSPLFLAKKTEQIRARCPEIDELSILPGYYQAPYFDVWIQSKDRVPEFQPITSEWIQAGQQANIQEKNATQPESMTVSRRLSGVFSASVAQATEQNRDDPEIGYAQTKFAMYTATRRADECTQYTWVKRFYDASGFFAYTHPEDVQTDREWIEQPKFQP